MKCTFLFVSQSLLVRVSKTPVKMLNGEKPNIGPCKIWVEPPMSFPIGNYIWKLIIMWHVICLNGALSMLYPSVFLIGILGGTASNAGSCILALESYLFLNIRGKNQYSFTVFSFEN